MLYLDISSKLSHTCRSCHWSVSILVCSTTLSTPLLHSNWRDPYGSDEIFGGFLACSLRFSSTRFWHSCVGEKENTIFIRLKNLAVALRDSVNDVSRCGLECLQSVRQLWHEVRGVCEGILQSIFHQLRSLDATYKHSMRKLFLDRSEIFVLLWFLESRSLKISRRHFPKRKPVRTSWRGVI